MQHISGKLKSDFNPDYSMRVCVFIKLHTFGFVFLDLDNSVVHMCLYLVVNPIMLLPFNQMECIIRAQCSLMACVYLLRKVCLAFCPDAWI